MPINRRRWPAWAMPAVLAVVLLAASAGATTMDEVELVCPVCGERFTGTEVGSTNTFGGMDRDLRSIAGGFQPVLIGPAVCPKCLYAGYPGGDFREGAVTPEVKTLILEKGALKLPDGAPKGLGGNEPPAWARHDLAAQTRALKGRSPSETAYAYLQASWAVRVAGDWKLYELLGDRLKTAFARAEELYPLNSRGTGNPADHIVKTAWLMAGDADGFPAADREIIRLAAAVLLAGHGEYSRALELVDAMNPEGDKEKLRALLVESDSLERRYQALAEGLLVEAVTNPSSEDEKKTRPVFLYLIGELNRRMGNWGKAREYFKQALADPDLPPDFKIMAEEQAALLPKGD